MASIRGPRNKNMPIQAVKRPRLAWIHPGKWRTRCLCLILCAANCPGDRHFTCGETTIPAAHAYGDVILPAAKRPSRQHTRCLVADAAYHRRPYFAGVLRARATSQPLATLRDMLTLPILLCCPPGPSSRQQGYHTPYGGILQVLSQRFWEKFSAPYNSAPIFFMRPSTMSPTLARSSAVKA